MVDGSPTRIGDRPCSPGLDHRDPDADRPRHRAGRDVRPRACRPRSRDRGAGRDRRCHSRLLPSLAAGADPRPCRRRQPRPGEPDPRDQHRARRGHRAARPAPRPGPRVVGPRVRRHDRGDVRHPHRAALLLSESLNESGDADVGSPVRAAGRRRRGCVDDGHPDRRIVRPDHRPVRPAAARRPCHGLDRGRWRRARRPGRDRGPSDLVRRLPAAAIAARDAGRRRVPARDPRCDRRSDQPVQGPRPDEDAHGDGRRLHARGPRPAGGHQAGRRGHRGHQWVPRRPDLPVGVRRGGDRAVRERAGSRRSPRRSRSRPA